VVLDLLHDYFKIAAEDDPRSRQAKVTGNVLTLDRSLEDTLPYLFSLLGIVDLLKCRSQADVWSAPQLPVLRKDEIHVVSDAIPKLFADSTYSIQPGDQGVAAIGRQFIRNHEGLLEHAHQRGEVTLVVIYDVAAKPGGALAIENHQLCHSGGIAYGLLVIGNGLLGFGDRRILFPEHVRPEPPVDRLLVCFQDILPQVEAGVKKRLIILLCSVEILDQAQQSGPIQTSEL